MQLNSSALNNCFHLRDKGFSNGLNHKDSARHRWYLVKEAFSPQLVQSAIESCSLTNKDYIVDPFSGSGTSILEASLFGFNAIAFEINPFLSFVSNVKLTQSENTNIDKYKSPLIKHVSKGAKSDLEKYSTFSENGKSKWLFNLPILRSFEGGWRYADGLSIRTKGLYHLALIGAAMDTCNAIRDGKCLRYRKDWVKKNYQKNDFINALDSRLSEIEFDLDNTPKVSENAQVLTGDVRQNIKILREKKVKFRLCITSPPYLNSFDYSDIYRPELFLGKFVANNEELMSLRLQTIRSHVQAKWATPTKSNFGFVYKKIMKEMEERTQLLWNRRIPLMIQAYFEDMSDILRSLRASAHSDAKVWLVVSTSAYAGIEIPVDLIIAEIATRQGWYLSEVGVLRNLRASGQHWQQWENISENLPKLRESVIILSAKPIRKRKIGT
jgi:hypothetical protein